MQFTVFEGDAALRDRHLQSNVLRGQDFFGSCCRLQYILASEPVVLHWSLLCVTAGFSRRGVCDFKPWVYPRVFCCYLQQFVGGVDSVLFFTMVFDGFLICIVIYNSLFGMPVKLLLFTIVSHPMLTCSWFLQWYLMPPRRQVGLGREMPSHLCVLYFIAKINRFEGFRCTVACSQKSKKTA